MRHRTSRSFRTITKACRHNPLDNPPKNNATIQDHIIKTKKYKDWADNMIKQKIYSRRGGTHVFPSSPFPSPKAKQSQATQSNQTNNQTNKQTNKQNKTNKQTNTQTQPTKPTHKNNSKY